MNDHDSEKIAGILCSEGYSMTDKPDDADLLVINTCSVRQKAEDKFFSQVGRFKSLKVKKPSLKIAVTGCIAQQRGEAIIKSAPYVDYVIGTHNIDAFCNIDFLKTRVINHENRDIVSQNFNALRKHKIKALVNIMYGCNNFCSYCIVPLTRGREKSRASSDIINEIRELAQMGYKEVMLLGQNVNSYKSDLDFTGLLTKIQEIDGIQRIRFMTSHPKDLSDDLINAFSRLEKLCEHIHLPLQSGSSKILRLMNRKYSYEEYLEKIKKLRKTCPEIAITSDIIAGFPGETEEDHQRTIKALVEIQFDGLFTFKYSKRPGTSAVSLPGHLSEDIKDRRLQEIIEVQDKITESKNKNLLGNFVEIMIEEESDKAEFNYIGRTRTNKIVYVKSNLSFSYGTFLNVLIKKTNRHSLEADY